MNFKIAFVSASLMAFAGIITVGCGGTDCESAADTILAKQQACGVTQAATAGSTSGTAPACSATLGANQLCIASCTDKADCTLIKVDPAKPPTTEQSKSFGDCLAACPKAM
jgi:hypothetical protein